MINPDKPLSSVDPQTKKSLSRQSLGPDPSKPKEEGYAPKDRFLWDSWVLKDKDAKGQDQYRLYHLDAPEDPDPDTRHHIAQVRTAVSDDLVNWKDEGYALTKGPEGSWDDKAIWTGNTYKKDDGYYFFYTGRNDRDGEIQRIGLATSENGRDWSRAEKPLLEPDGRYYETTEDSPVFKAWRDPEVIKDEKTGKYHMFFTAKTKEGDPTYKGCIGVATADNFEGPYEAQPPVLAPGKFAQMECPQIIQKNDKVYMFFQSMEKDYNPEWADSAGGPQNGLHCYVGDSLTGPFEPLNGDGIVTRSKDNLYSVKLVEDPQREGEFQAIGWYMEDREVTAAKNVAHGAVPGPAGAAMRILEKGLRLLVRVTSSTISPFRLCLSIDRN